MRTKFSQSARILSMLSLISPCIVEAAPTPVEVPIPSGTPNFALQKCLGASQHVQAIVWIKLPEDPNQATRGVFNKTIRDPDEDSISEEPHDLGASPNNIHNDSGTVIPTEHYDIYSRKNGFHKNTGTTEKIVVHLAIKESWPYRFYVESADKFYGIGKGEKNEDALCGPHSLRGKKVRMVGDTKKENVQVASFAIDPDYFPKLSERTFNIVIEDSNVDAHIHQNVRTLDPKIHNDGMPLVGRQGKSKRKH